MRIYKQGLKPALFTKLIRSKTAINNLEDLTYKAICLDNKLYKLALIEQSYCKVTRIYNKDKS
jgi:antitoxin component YwqK of YwqJK toxin-antitoxin module